ncbi:MAG: polysaccharide deacetylase family protein [Oscillospiraceae bacterium]
MKKAKRLAALALCLCLLLLALPPVESAADSPSFISVNDLLPSELVGTLYSYGGALYVPYTVFTGYGLGIYYSYFSESSTAYLYTLDKQLFFSLGDGKTFDGDDYYYSASAILRNGVVYLPVSFMCSYFGLSYSYITGSVYGNVLRIKNGTQVLTDAEFVRAARNVMQSHYDAWNAAQPPAVSPSPAPTPTRTPAPEAPDRERPDVSLNFVGLPSAGLLDTLDAYGVKGCFFLTGEELRADPDTVRRIAGEGHSLGLLCQENVREEYAAFSALLFEAAQIRTVLVTADSAYAADCAREAEELSLVFCSWGLDALVREGETASAYHVTYELDATQSNTDVFLDAASAETTLPTILDYLLRSGYGLLLLRETD